MRRLGHLVRRWVSSLSRAEPSVGDVEWVTSVLTPGELGIWMTMAVADRRHSIVVARRFVELAPDAGRAFVAAALLHDVGKSASNLSTTGRVIATILGPRGERFVTYHRHEEIGVEMCRRAGSHDETIAVLSGEGNPTMVEALRAADDI
jgi:putative nucleotidyltransferase with HDIG domain